MHQNYIGFIELGGLSPEIQFNTRVIYILKKLAKIFFKKHFEQNGWTDRAEIWYDYAMTYGEYGKTIDLSRAAAARVLFAKNCFWGFWKIMFFGFNFFLCGFGRKWSK